MHTHLTSAAIYHMNYLQAVVIGLVQGLFELFPLSSLGHTVLVPSWIGGTWATLVRQESEPESPYLAFVVGLHLANAVALLVFYLREWARVISAFFHTLWTRRIESDRERLAWLIVVATVPVGILGLAFEHEFRVLFAKPVAAAAFLVCNGAILLLGEWWRRRGGVGPRQGTAVSVTEGPRQRTEGVPFASSGARGAVASFRGEHMVAIDEAAEHQLAGIGLASALWIGASQALALLAGISREGVAMVGGLSRGLSNENAMRFAFLLSTPVIFAAGALKVPDLTGALGDGVRGQVVAGSVAAVAMSIVALAFMTRWMKTRTLKPFAVYSLLFGLASLVRFGIF
ncbi:MAG TPA: undecaprenyl-diphosphate phosphatase [Acidimicrobiales bacterium]|nr:undecaprenyl-diphosphate phosphatase [Acidimicrobiales bacterium]